MLPPAHERRARVVLVSDFVLGVSVALARSALRAPRRRRAARRRGDRGTRLHLAGSPKPQAMRRCAARGRSRWRGSRGATSPASPSLDATCATCRCSPNARSTRPSSYAAASLEPRFGRPRDADGKELPLLVLGMGKLGGHELNFSSDVDLVFLYPDGGRRRRDVEPRDLLPAPRPAPDQAARPANRRRLRVPRRHAPAAVRQQRPARRGPRARSRHTSSSTAAIGSATPMSKRGC